MTDQKSLGHPDPSVPPATPGSPLPAGDSETTAPAAGDPAAVLGSLVGARRDALIYFPAQAVPAVVGAVQTAVFTQIFSPAAWGVYALALSIVQLAVVTVSAWHDRATVRFVSGEEGRRAALGGTLAVEARSSRPALEIANRLTWWNIALFSVAAIPAILVVAALWPDSVLLAAAGVIFGIASLLNTGMSAVHRALLHSWVVVRSKLVASLAGFFLSLLAVLLLGPSPSLLMMGPAMGMLIAGMMLISALPAGRRLPALSGTPVAADVDFGVTAPTPRLFLRYGLPLTGFYVAGWILNLSDRFLIYGFADASQVGIYAPNYAIGALLISLATVPLSAAMTSRILRLSEASSDREIARSVGKASRDFLLTTVPVLVWAIVARDQITAVLLGPDFRAGTDVIPLVAAGTLTWALGQYVHKPLEIRNRTMTLLLLAVVCCLFNIALNVALIPSLGYMGAAWSTFIAYSLYPVLAYLLTRSSVRWIVPWKTVWSLLAASAVCLLLGNGLVAVVPGLHPVILGGALAALVGLVTLLVLLLTGETSLRRLISAFRDILGSSPES